MKNLFSLILIIFPGVLAFASGGMIGGGEANYKPLMACTASGIDPTFPSPPHVWVVKEIDFSGKFLEKSNLRVVTLNKKLEPIQFFVTHQTHLFEDPVNIWSLKLWQYEKGSAGNSQIGAFHWDKASTTGVLSYSSKGGNITDLPLFSCSLTPH